MDINELAGKYGPCGIHYGHDGGLHAVWTGLAMQKGFVMLVPSEPGVVWCRDPEQGIKHLLEYPVS